MIATLSGCFKCSKNEPNDDCEIYYQCNIETVKLLKLKKNEQIESRGVAKVPQVYHSRY